MKKIYLLFAVLLPFQVFAQAALADSLGLAIAPGLTPVVAKGQTEIGFFNASANYQSADTSGFRAAQLSHFLQIQRGFSRQNRLSVGIDAVFTNLRFGPASEVAPFSALGSAPPNGVAAHTLTSVGVRVRYVPFIWHPEFTVQSSLNFPVASPTNRLLLGEDRVRFSVQGNYATLFAPGWYAIGQLGPQVRFSNTTRKQTTWELPISAYLVRRAWTTAHAQRLYVFGSLGYFSSFEKRYKAGLRQVNWLFYAGLGAQWVFNPSWSLSLGWQGLPAFDGSVAIKKGSYSNLTLGARYVGKM